MPLEPYVRQPSGISRSLWKSTRTVAADTTTTYGQLDAISADKFRSYWGVRIFPTRAAPNVYSELHTTAGRAWLSDLAPQNVTHLLTPSWGAPTKTLTSSLGAAGTKSVLTVGVPFAAYSSAEWDDMMGNIADVGDHLLMVNGQNEVNHVRGTGTLPANWAQIAADHQTILWNRMSTLNATRTAAGKAPILVGSPNLWSGSVPTHHADLATLAPLVRNVSNVACFHLYPRGEHPTWKLDEFIAEYRKAANYGAGTAMWCTEAGYYDAQNYTGGAVPVTQATKAIYQKKQWLEYARRDIPVGYFEFLDDVDVADVDRESSLGMVNVPAMSASTWEAKPSYTQMRTMLARKGGVSGKVSCTVTTTGDVVYLAVTSSAGTILYIWRVDNIERDRFVPLTLSPATVAVTVSSPNITTTTVNVGGDVVALAI